jgi:hypothetical protein
MVPSISLNSNEGSNGTKTEKLEWVGSIQNNRDTTLFNVTIQPLMAEKDLFILKKYIMGEFLSKGILQAVQMDIKRTDAGFDIELQGAPMVRNKAAEKVEFVLDEIEKEGKDVLMRSNFGRDAARNYDAGER